MSKAEFARRCGVSRAAVTKAAAKDKQLIVIEPDGSIDPAHPINRSYMEMHARPGTGAAPNAGDGSATGQKKRPRQPRNMGNRGKGKEPEIDGLDKETRDILADSEDGEDESGDQPDTGGIIKFVEDARKVKLQADMLEIAKAEKLGIVVLRTIVEALFGGISQFIFSEFVESVRPDAILICKALGVPGKESIVVDILSPRNQSRLKNMQRLINETLASKLLKK